MKNKKWKTAKENQTSNLYEMQDIGNLDKYENHSLHPTCPCSTFSERFYPDVSFTYFHTIYSK